MAARELRYAVCPHCSATFSTTNLRQAYCSQECSTAAMHARLAEYDAASIVRSAPASHPAPFLIRRPHTATCTWCTATFSPKRKEQRFCSSECVREAGQARLQVLRDAGEDPAHGGDAAEARREACLRRARHAKALKKLDKGQRAYVDALLAGELPVPAASGSSATEDNADTTHRVPLGVDGDTWRASGERWARLVSGRSMLTLAGHGCRVSVNKDALLVRSGFTHSTQQPEEWRLERGVHEVRTIILLGQSGSVTLDALQWCQDQDICLLVIDRDGQLTTAVSPPSPPLVELRRLQYRADPLPIARLLVVHKLRESAKARPMVTEEMQAWKRDADKAASLEALRIIEGQAAITYWNAWRMELRWTGQHPTYWNTFKQRESPIGSQSSARYAAHPVNAMLNYAYAVLAGHLERAIVTRGLDPAMGYLHAPRDGRASLVYDLIEPLRARVDALLLPWIAQKRWTRSDFTVDRTGCVRLHPQLGRVVVQQSALPDKDTDAMVEWLVGTLRGIAVGIEPR